MVVDLDARTMQVSSTPDYGAGENGWRRLLIEQANDLVLDGVAELFPWLVGQAWEVKRAGLLAGPLPVLPGAGEPEAKFQDLAQDGGDGEGDGDHGLGPDHVLGSDLGLGSDLELASDPVLGSDLVFEITKMVPDGAEGVVDVVEEAVGVVEELVDVVEVVVGDDGVAGEPGTSWDPLDW